MKVLAISDNVLPKLESTDYLRRTYSDVDVLISCGDLPGPYLDLIATTLNLPVLFVKGNHDTQYEPGQPGGDDLQGRLVHFGGLSFAGLEGSPRYNDAPILQYREEEMFAMVLRLTPRILLKRMRSGAGIDVLVTHAPPRGIHDLPDRAHKGFRSLHLAINLFRPHYLLHGHVDTWDNRKTTVTHLRDTEIININPVKLLTLERRPPRGL